MSWNLYKHANSICMLCRHPATLKAPNQGDSEHASQHAFQAPLPSWKQVTIACWVRADWLVVPRDHTTTLATSYLNNTPSLASRYVLKLGFWPQGEDFPAGSESCAPALLQAKLGLGLQWWGGYACRQWGIHPYHHSVTTEALSPQPGGTFPP